MEFGKRHDTTDTTDVCPHQLVADLSFMTCRLCCGLVRGSRQLVIRTCYGETGVMDFGLYRSCCTLYLYLKV